MYVCVGVYGFFVCVCVCVWKCGSCVRVCFCMDVGGELWVYVGMCYVCGCVHVCVCLGV